MNQLKNRKFDFYLKTLTYDSKIDKSRNPGIQKYKNFSRKMIERGYFN